MPIRPSSEGLQALTQEWESEMRTKPNEEMVVVNHFSRGVGVRKIQNQLNIRIVPTILAQSLAASDTGKSITFDTSALTSVNAQPQFFYGGVELPLHLTSKLTDSDSASLKAGYRKQLMASMNTKIDVAGAALSPGISTQLGVAPWDKSLMLAAKQLLATNAKDHVKLYNGRTAMFLVYHPSGMAQIDNIQEITSAYIRGDSKNPTVTGVVVDAWGLELSESGNVYVAGGVAWNMIYTNNAFVIGYNLDPYLIDPQPFDLVVKMISATEVGVTEVFDEDGVVVKTPTS